MENPISPAVPDAVDNSGTTSGNVENVQSDRSRPGYGCLCCRPSCLKCLAGTKWFLFFLWLAIFFGAMTEIGLVGITVSTIERRFSLASSQTAWITGTYEIVGAPSALIIGYLGLSVRRPVWIGGGMIVMGIGFGLYSVPHFAASLYQYSGEVSNLCMEPALNASNNASLLPNYRCGVFSTRQHNASSSSSYLFSDNNIITTISQK